MYQKAKKFIGFFIPKRLLFRFEPIIRSIHYGLAYRGNDYECNICNRKLKTWIELPNGNLICPGCGSSGRDRRLWMILNEYYLGKKLRHLDFSPSRALYRALKKVKSHEYHASDISGDFLAEKNYDITNIDAEDHFYDLITCYHVLEHVEDDLKAMGELFRILSVNGVCLIQTPFREGEIFEDASIVTKEDRLKYFGQEDHVRVYSIAGLEYRLKSSGFAVERLSFESERDNKHGLPLQETILSCTKRQA